MSEHKSGANSNRSLNSEEAAAMREQYQIKIDGRIESLFKGKNEVAIRKLI